MANYYIGRDGQLYSDELMHYKYLDRKKVNGKWRYYYTQEQLDEAKAELERAKDQWGTDMYKSDMALARMTVYGEKKYGSEYEKSLVKVHQSKKRAQAAAKEYESMKMNSFTPKTVNRGLAIIKNIFMTRR